MLVVREVFSMLILIDKGLDEGVGDLGIGSAVGAVGGLDYKNVAAFDLNVTLKR